MSHDHQTTASDRALTRRIMRRVYVVAGIRLLLHPVFLKSLLVVLFFVNSTRYVSYGNVIANAPSILDLESNIRFFTGALAHTATATLYLYLAIRALAFWIVLDMARHKRAWI
jgi:hypothetical protein